MEVIILIFFLTWYVLVIALIAGWPKPAGNSRTRVEFPVGLRISVIVPVRNEEENLPALLEDLLNQTVLPYEIIVADDHSSDQTQLVVRQFAARYPCIKLISLPENIVGKKAALQLAIAISKGEIIVTTDGDCRVGVQWLENIGSAFSDVHVQMVAGPVLFADHNPVARLLNVEQVVLQSAAVASFRLGYPLFCSGANMAFRKSAFEEVKGYEGFAHLASGDDVFLMQKIGQRYPTGLAYCASPHCLVLTQAPTSTCDFVFQRVRWAGKWRLLGRNVQLVATFVFLFQIIVISLPFLALNWIITLPFILLLTALKWMLEWMLVSKVAQHLQAKFSAGWFLLAQVIYPVYVITIGILSFRTKTLWKGRSISTR